MPHLHLHLQQQSLLAISCARAASHPTMLQPLPPLSHPSLSLPQACLSHGTSEACDTFDSIQLSGGPTPRFDVVDLEVS